MGILESELPAEIASDTNWHRYIADDALDGLMPLSRRLSDAAEALTSERDMPRQRLLALVSLACSLRLTLGAKPLFQPLHRGNDSFELADFGTLDVTILAAIAEPVANPLVRARLADVSVTAGFALGIRPWPVGAIAARAYLEAAEQYLMTADGDQIVAEFRRGLDLASWLCRQDEELHQRYGALLQAAVAFSLEHGELSMAFELVDEVKHRRPDLVIETAKLLEAAAHRHTMPPEPDPDAGANCYARASTLWHRAKKWADATRCELLRGEALVSRASRGEGGAYARALWLSEGIRVLHKAGADGGRVTELRHQLEAFQRASMDDFRGTGFASYLKGAELLEISRLIDKTIAGPSLFEALLQMTFGLGGCCIHEEVRQDVIDRSGNDVLSELFGLVLVNAQGAPIARQEPLDVNAEEALYAAMVRDCHDFELQRRARLLVSPCADLLFTRYHPSLADILELTYGSVVIPNGHAESVARGLAAGFNDDWLEAAAYLVPKVEPVLRHLFHQQHLITTVLRPNGTHSEASIDELLNRPDAKQVLGENLILELNALLVHPMGYMLRHNWAHGLVTDDAMVNPGILSLWWTMWRLVMWQWRDSVSVTSTETQQ